MATDRNGHDLDNGTSGAASHLDRAVEDLPLFRPAEAGAVDDLPGQARVEACGAGRGRVRRLR
ncbi:hypothetical protein RB201_27580 [Streptomyces sp. S1A(2023)]